MIDQHQLNIQYKTRYFTHGKLNENTKYIWLVFHGYGQLAEYFIRKFKDLGNDHFVIAPEGLSRFYLANTSGRVGATWMTKEDRLTDITNQITYINAIYQKIKPQIDSGTKWAVLGFSQGTATAMRWLVNRNVAPDKLVLWAGTIPPDLAAENPNIDLSAIDTFLLKGDSDPYIGTAHMKNMDEWLTLYKVNYRLINYSGGHEIEAKTLNQLAGSF